MKKVLISAALCSAFCVSNASAAMILGFGAEADYYHPEVSGHFNYDGDMKTTTDFGSQKKGTYQIGAYFEHPVPFVPNVRIDYTPMKFDGTSSIVSAKGVTGFAAGTAKNDIKLNALDVTPYYEILDNVVSLDLGLTIRSISASIDTTQSGLKHSDSATFALPMAYIAAEAKLPFTGLKANADLKYLGFGNSNYMDAKAKLTYDVIKGLGVEAGYRYQKLKLDKFDVDADVTFKGPFVGLNYNF